MYKHSVLCRVYKHSVLNNSKNSPKGSLSSCLPSTCANHGTCARGPDRDQVPLINHDDNCEDNNGKDDYDNCEDNHCTVREDNDNHEDNDDFDNCEDNDGRYDNDDLEDNDNCKTKDNDGKDDYDNNGNFLGDVRLWHDLFYWPKV